MNVWLQISIIQRTDSGKNAPPGKIDWGSVLVISNVCPTGAECM